MEEMARRSCLADFELMVILTLIYLGEDAYGVPISRELEKRLKREVSVAGVYAALERLEVKGLIASSLGDPTPERGGKAKRYFRVTKQGLQEVHATRQVLTKLWRGLPRLKGERV